MSDILITKNPIFNPTGDDDVAHRTIIQWSTTGIYNLNDVKYPWAKAMYQVMIGNFWVPEKVSGLKDDQRDFHSTLSPEEQRAYKGILSFLIFLDSIQTVNLPNFSNYITSPEVNLLLAIQTYQECLTEEAEFLSQHWWKRLVDYEKGDKVLQYNPDWTTEFVYPSNYTSYQYEWEIFQFESEKMLQRVTPNHRMPIITHNCIENLKITAASKLKDGEQSFWFISWWPAKWNIAYLTDYERFLIALQADWTIQRQYINENWEILYKNRTGKHWFIACTFSFSKERKINRLTNLLQRLGFNYSVCTVLKKGNSKEKKVFRVKVPSYLKVTKDFKDWVNISDNNSCYYKDFMEEISHWDASKKWKHLDWVYYFTSDKDNIEIISAVSVLAWYQVLHYSKEDNRKESYKKIYYISVRNTQVISRSTVNKTSHQYKWLVSCFTVDSGMFVMRSGTRISVTWNCIHSQSYATILETVVSAEERDAIYYYWREDQILLQRNAYIGQIYQDFVDHPTDQSFFRGIVANFLLEWLYFYNGFAFFDTLVDHMKMPATGRMIAYIRRDELTHVTLFANILREIRREFPDIYDEQVIIEMTKTAVEQEVEWSQHILGDRIPGVNYETTVDYTRWLANQRLDLLKISPLFPWVENPYKHLDRLQDPNGDKGNFFESTVINYTQSSNMAGSWDF